MKRKEQFKNTGEIMEALALCLDIQNNGIGTVFFDLSGHVNQCTVQIYLPVWEPESKPDIKINFYDDCDSLQDIQSVIEKLKKIVDDSTTEASVFARTIKTA